MEVPEELRILHGEQNYIHIASGLEWGELIGMPNIVGYQSGNWEYSYKRIGETYWRHNTNEPADLVGILGRESMCFNLFIVRNSSIVCGGE